MLETQRLILRLFTEYDKDAFAKLNACSNVCRYFPKKLNKNESDYLADKIIKQFYSNGFGLWAVQRKDNNKFIGFTGLNIPDFEANFMPAIEIGWRLSYNDWGQGFATEAAIAARDYAFNDLSFNEIVSFTTKNNEASRKVMHKIGMSHNQEDDFYHPKLNPDSLLSYHVLYRLNKEQYYNNKLV
jgi:3-dehydroquinate dehydratase/shikimate dehydrogenase